MSKLLCVHKRTKVADSDHMCATRGIADCVFDNLCVCFSVHDVYLNALLVAACLSVRVPKLWLVTGPLHILTSRRTERKKNPEAL